MDFDGVENCRAILCEEKEPLSTSGAGSAHDECAAAINTHVENVALRYKFNAHRMLQALDPIDRRVFVLRQRGGIGLAPSGLLT